MPYSVHASVTATPGSRLNLIDAEGRIIQTAISDERNKHLTVLTVLALSREPLTYAFTGERQDDVEFSCTLFGEE